MREDELQVTMDGVMGWIVSSKYSYVEVLTPCTSECDLFGNRFVVYVISQDEIILEWDGPLIQYDCCPYKKGEICT